MSPGAASARPTVEPPWIVLDTNVVLDWLLFDDAAARPLAVALAERRLRWATTASMLDELASVLSRPWVAARPAGARVLARAESACRVVAPRAASGTALRCADASDQAFIDLALALPARWLFSRDHALLALARPAALRGVAVMRPSDWRGPD